MPPSGLLFFLYGLVFIVLGLSAIIIGATNKTNYVFLKKIYIFGFFALLTGLFEWQHFFEPLLYTQLKHELFAINLVHRLSNLAADVFFLVFAVELVVNWYNKLSFLRIIVVIFLAVFFIYLFIFPGNRFIRDISVWSITIENLGRRLIVIPAGIITFIAVLLNAKRYPKENQNRFNLIIFVTALLIYCLIIGIFAINTKGVPLGNLDLYDDITGVPLEATEIVLGSIMFVALLLLRYFLNHEYYRRNISIRDSVLIDSERNRIARDLHDSVIQDLYGLSFRLAHSNNLLLKGDSEDARKNMEYVQDSLGETIKDIRNYIYSDLNEKYRYENLDDGIRHILNELKELTPLDIDFTYVNKNQRALSKEIIVNIYLIIKEACINIIKHASATKAGVSLKLEMNCLKLIIWDDGIGLIEGKKHGMGLVTMRERVESLRGTLEIIRDKGTQLLITIPLGG